MGVPTVMCKCDRCGQPLKITARGRFVPCPCAQVEGPVESAMPLFERPERPMDPLVDDDL